MTFEIPSHICEQHGEMAMIAMRRGERARAVRAINRAFEIAAEQAAEVVTLGSFVDTMFVANTVSALNEINVETVGDLITYTPQQLATVRNINWLSIQKIQSKLESCGFQLGADPEQANSVDEDAL